METNFNTSEQECCPKLQPELWDNKIFNWQNKLFVREKVFTLFYMPMNFGKVMKRLDEKIRAAGATVLDSLCLADHTSKWNMNVYLAIDKIIPGSDNVPLSGNFYTRVYEGPFKDTGKWCKDFETHASTKGMSIDKWFMWYTTCPKCAKKYGKNYVVIVAQIKESAEILKKDKETQLKV